MNDEPKNSPLSDDELALWEANAQKIVSTLSHHPDRPTFDPSVAWFGENSPEVVLRLIAMVRAAKTPAAEPSEDLSTFARSLGVVLEMLYNDATSGMYGTSGRPNITSLKMFLAYGLALPELGPLARAYHAHTGFQMSESDRPAAIVELRRLCAELRGIVERIPANHRKFPKVGQVDGKLVKLGETPGERAELLAWLDGKDPILAGHS